MTHDEHLDDGWRLSPLTIGLLALVGFCPLLAQFFWNLWNFDTYQFFPLALAGAGLLAWRGLQETERPLEGGSGFLTLPLVLSFLGLLATAAVLWSPWMGMAAFLVAILAMAWWLGGWTLLRAVFPAWILLITVLPPPLRLDQRFALQLQEWATEGSSRVLALLGVPHLLSGLLIEIPGQRLLVEEACSGINSILFMTSACVFYAMWQRRGVFFLATLYALTIGCVLAGNLVRITFGAWIFFHHQIDLFSGWKHEAVGLVLTATYLIFIIAGDAILARIFTLHGKDHHEEPVAKSSEPLLDGLYFEGGIKVLAIVLALLGVVQLARGWAFHFGMDRAQVINPAWMDGSAKFKMPPQIAGWELISEGKPVPKKAAFEDGVFSHLWQYQKDGVVATISLDFPFFGYHDVTVCYGNSGWEVQKTKLQSATPENNMIPCMEVSLARKDGVNADLFYSTIDETGVWLEEPGERSPYDAEGTPLQEGSLSSRIEHRLRQLPFAGEATDKQFNYRIQLLAAARGGLGSAQRRQVEKLFREARVVLCEQFIEPTPEKPQTPMEEQVNEGITL